MKRQFADDMTKTSDLGTDDLNEAPPIGHTGMLLMEDAEPQDIARVKRDSRTTAGNSRPSREFLKQALAAAWEIARQLEQSIVRERD